MRHIKSFQVAIMALCATLPAFGQQTFSDVTITGQLDLTGSIATFGSISGTSGQPGMLLSYNDGVSGTGSAFTETLTRAGASWVVQHAGNNVAGFRMDSSDSITLTGTQSSNPGSIVLNPNAGTIIVNGQQAYPAPNLNLSGNGYIQGGLGVGIVNSTPGTIQSLGAITTSAALLTSTLSSPTGAVAVEPGGGKTFFNATSDNGSNALVQIAASNNQDPNYQHALYITGLYANVILDDTGPVNLGGNAAIDLNRNGRADWQVVAVAADSEGTGDRDTFVIKHWTKGLANFLVDANDNIFLGQTAVHAPNTALVTIKPASNQVNISGSLDITGACHIQPHGDLSMGPFTARP